MDETDFNSEIESGNPLFNLYDLSFIELLIVNELVKIAESEAKISILRHDLYKTINDLIKSHKKLSTSSFYRYLEKLKDRRLLESKQSDDINYRNAIEVRATPQASQMIGFLFHFLIQFNAQTNTAVLDYIEEQLLDELGKHIDLSTIRRIRIIDPSIRVDSPADLIATILPEAIPILQIMANAVMTNSWGVSFLVNLLSTNQVFTWVGTEADLSDLIMYPLYDRNAEYLGRSYVDIIREMKKILADNAYVLFIHLKEIESDHHYVDILTRFLRLTPYYQTFDPSKLTLELSEIGFSWITSFEYRGIAFLLMQKE